MAFLRRFAALAGVGALALIAAPAGPAHAQQLPGSGEATPDSVAERLGLPQGHAPRGAFRRALMVPGWGQYYNRQYWKMPLVAAGLGAVIYALAYSWDRYFLYRDAWRYRRSNGRFVPEGEEYTGDYGGETYRTAYQTLVRQGLEGGNGGLRQIVKQRRGKFRRWGEMAILGVGVFWILQVADAYVSAHLLGFEVNAPSSSPAESSDEDLSVRVAPAPAGGVAAGLRFQF
ncbi:MAG: hypothetical protein BRD37_03355 [Bacteroidetes bacterium QH_8_67_23]|nr:MAG: hypothetical protein BRD37_03355 [Bacteroidetes bacterium QH_8_67_23]